MNQQKPSILSYIHLHLLVLVWGFTAIAGLMVSVSAYTLVWYRTLLATVGLLIILMLNRINFKLSLRQLLPLLGVGGIIALHWLFFFESARVANASVCLAGLATTSFWTSLVEPIVKRRKISFVEVLLGCLIFVGLYLIFLFEFNRIWGLFLGVLSALMAAFFSTINSHFTHRYTASVITFYEMLGAFVAISATMICLSATNIQHFDLVASPTDWLWFLFLAWVCSVYAYTVAVQLLRKFTAFSMNLVINLEPVYGIILAYLFLGEKEKMTPGFYIGTLVIVLAVLIHPFLAKYTPNKIA